MTDFELNKAIAELVYPDATEITHFSSNGAGVIIYGVSKVFKAIQVDYCNNWNDLMPLVVEYDINLLSRREDGYSGRGRWMVQHVTETKAEVVKMDHFSNWTYIEEFNDNPQRALAECLLLVLQEKAK